MGSLEYAIEKAWRKDHLQLAQRNHNILFQFSHVCSSLKAYAGKSLTVQSTAAFIFKLCLRKESSVLLHSTRTSIRQSMGASIYISFSWVGLLSVMSPHFFLLLATCRLALWKVGRSVSVFSPISGLVSIPCASCFASSNYLKCRHSINTHRLRAERVQWKTSPL